MNSPASQAVYVSRGGALPLLAPTVDVQDVGPGSVCGTGNWNVRAALGSHMEPFLTLLVYRVDCADLSVVFAADTKP